MDSTALKKQKLGEKKRLRFGQIGMARDLRRSLGFIDERSEEENEMLL